ncbi:MAG: mechanosensitive ion channel family protein [Peptoniphilaceae bacterium]|nr:mechanosensitive ion channel family protein [Peptoniphilaceae bacterium]MDY6019329.1 mechanosensitive ion channel family protein [Anaerococcus sp.]
MFNEITKNQTIQNLIVLVLIGIGGKLILNFFQKIINKYFEENERKNPLNSAKVETLSKALSSVVRFIIGFIVVIIILDMLGINTRSIIATAGIGGIAIAFGAQSIIQDFIKGMFMIIDDVIRVGDFVECAGISGTIESVGLRLTKIRDYDGSLHTIPNSQIQNIKNYNRGPQRAEVTFSVSYDTSLDQVRDICKTVSAKLLKIKGFENIFIEKPRFLGIEDMQDLSYKVKLTALVLEGNQYEVKRKTRELIKEELENRKIQASVLEKK